jgi:trehalose/maltose hydrolase-like predicted phosphorylase
MHSCCISPINIHCAGLREIHISGDIAQAISQYWFATLDLEWLSGPGHAMLAGIADFFVSRATPGPGGTLNINDVIPPDEYQDHVNNSVYTNAVAQLALLAAVNADRTLGMPPARFEYSVLALARCVIVIMHVVCAVIPSGCKQLLRFRLASIQYCRFTPNSMVTVV